MDTAVAGVVTAFGALVLVLLWNAETALVTTGEAAMKSEKSSSPSALVVLGKGILDTCGGSCWLTEPPVESGAADSSIAGGLNTAEAVAANGADMTGNEALKIEAGGGLVTTGLDCWKTVGVTGFSDTPGSI